MSMIGYTTPVAAHWDGDVLVLTTRRVPSSIHVQRGEGETRKVYTGEPELIVETTAPTKWSASCTPAQAIAATVGSDKVGAVLRKLIARLGVAADFHFARKYVDCIVEEYTGKLVTLGAGTCHDLGGTDANGNQVFNCDKCGCVLSLYDRDGSNNLCTSFIFDYPRFCPECGCEVTMDER